MERITSRKNAYITHLRSVSRDAEYRNAAGEYLCDGLKLFQEAVAFGAEITSVLWKESAMEEFAETAGTRQYCTPDELFAYASPMQNSPGPLFTVKIPEQKDETEIRKAIVLENVQDPGNVGTVIRTANAFGIDAVILTGACADLYNPKTVRSTMGAIFRQRVMYRDLEGLRRVLKSNCLKMYGAVLSDRAVSVLDMDVCTCAVAVGSEGKGLSWQMRDLCDGEIIIPMEPCSESLNAAVAASVLMWEMRGRK